MTMTGCGFSPESDELEYTSISASSPFRCGLAPESDELESIARNSLQYKRLRAIDAKKTRANPARKAAIDQVFQDFVECGDS